MLMKRPEEEREGYCAHDANRFGLLLGLKISQHCNIKAMHIQAQIMIKYAKQISEQQRRLPRKHGVPLVKHCELSSREI